MEYLLKTQFFLNYFIKLRANISKTNALLFSFALKFCTGICLQRSLNVNKIYLLTPAPPPPKKNITPNKNPKLYQPPVLGKA